MQGEGNSVVCGTITIEAATSGGQSNGPPVIQACDFIFLRYGHNGSFFEA